MVPRPDLIQDYRIKGPVCFRVGKPGYVFRTMSRALNPAYLIAVRYVFQRRERTYTNLSAESSIVEMHTLRYEHVSSMSPVTYRAYSPSSANLFLVMRSCVLSA